MLNSKLLLSNDYYVETGIYMENLFNWLIEITPWIEYSARLDLLQEEPNSAAVKDARQILISDPQMNMLLQELDGWPGQALKSHKSASLLIHKLTFITDVGFRLSDPGISGIVDKITAHRSPDGPFQTLVNLHRASEEAVRTNGFGCCATLRFCSTL